MKLIFRGAIVDAGEFQALTVRSDWTRKWHSACLSPGNVRVYETTDCNKAYRFIAEVGKALKQGLSCGAEWIDCSGLPGSVETGIVVLRGDEE